MLEQQQQWEQQQVEELQWQQLELESQAPSDCSSLGAAPLPAAIESVGHLAPTVAGLIMHSSSSSSQEGSEALSSSSSAQDLPAASITLSPSAPESQPSPVLHVSNQPLRTRVGRLF